MAGSRPFMKRIGVLLASISAVLSAPAGAWGYEGHKVIALIARAELTPAVRAKVDAILATDPDTLTEPGMAPRATWADAWRGAGHRETAEWHFVDIELDHPDLAGACFGFPPGAVPASAGPAHDCVVDKVREFAAELGDPATTPAERLLALKYLLHFVGDIHQPLHASDNQDRGGNCVLLTGAGAPNLHAYWDTTVVEALGRDPDALATTLRARITRSQRANWRRIDLNAWARESYRVSRAKAYRVGSPRGCPTAPVPIALPKGYAGAARSAATLQLQRAGVRLGAVLNRALARVRLT